MSAGRTGGIAAAAALVLLAGSAQAQISAQGGAIDVSADRLEVRERDRVNVWSGRVEALQGQNRLRANTLSVYFSKAAGDEAAAVAPGTNWGDIDRLEAVGEVYFVTPEQVVRGDKAVYSVEADTIVVTGNVVLAQGENVLKGDRLTIQVASGRATMDAGGRVRGVFFPGKQESGR